MYLKHVISVFVSLLIIAALTHISFTSGTIVYLTDNGCQKKNGNNYVCCYTGSYFGNDQNPSKSFTACKECHIDGQLNEWKCGGNKIKWDR